LGQIARQGPTSDGGRRDVRSNIFKDKGDPLLFPFLILEAKSEKSNDDFEQIQCQTALPIKALLLLQDDLRHKAIQVNSPGPLIWFLSYRGEKWRVHGCYIKDKENLSYVRKLFHEHANGNFLSLQDINL